VDFASGSNWNARSGEDHSSRFRQIDRPLTNSYFVSTVGGAPLAIVKQYIENQKHA
jgi:REP element-mobilizing transposase RayT